VFLQNTQLDRIVPAINDRVECERGEHRRQKCVRRTRALLSDTRERGLTNVQRRSRKQSIG
jgi:hypothetical protein